MDGTAATPPPISDRDAAAARFVPASAGAAAGAAERCQTASANERKLLPEERERAVVSMVVAASDARVDAKAGKANDDADEGTGCWSCKDRR